jgi:hypothetical protein
MAVLGLAREHLDDAMAEIARHVLAMGAHLVYGGDLRAGGFTELLFELVAKHTPTANIGEGVRASNFLPWPVHLGLRAKDLEKWAADLSGTAELVCLTADGKRMRKRERVALKPRAVNSRRRLTPP